MISSTTCLLAVLAAALPAAAAERPHPGAELFPLQAVRLLDSPFRVAQETDHDYLLQLEPDRLLAWFRKEAGLKPKAEVYPGWEVLGVAGHTLGHYLSALSTMWQATGDERLRARVDYIIDELTACQEANGNGCITAIPGGKKAFAEIAAGHLVVTSRFNLNGLWVPWYTTHKVFAGLIDAYERAGNQKARTAVIKMADWVGTVVGPLSDAQLQDMLSAEQGGMAESLAEVSAITGDDKYLVLARKFRHAAVFDPLARGEDRLNGLHGNTQVPKMIGYQRIYELSGDPAYGEVARNFWRFVVHDRSFATGGHGTHENFFPPSKFRENVDTAIGPETCNTYNMLKLSEHLFCAQPSVEVADYCERAMYNHILCTEAPGRPGSLVYYTSMRPGAFHTYSAPFGNFWCCVGTGMENHARYGNMIYAHEGDEKLLVNLFIPSELHWGGMTVRQETRYPAEGESTLMLSGLATPRTFTSAVRCPAWASGMQLLVNGAPVADAAPCEPGKYAEVRREWKNGDTLTVRLPLAIRTEPLPGTNDETAIFYGPVLLAGDLGRGGLTDADLVGQSIKEQKLLPIAQTPVLLASLGELPARVEPVEHEPLTFRFTADTVRPNPVTLRPFYTLTDQRYAIYWRLTDPAKYAQTIEAQTAADARERNLATRTCDRLTPGEQQAEVDHNFQSEKSHSGTAFDRSYRDAPDGGWFSYDLKITPDQPVTLRCTYWGDEGEARHFDILADGHVIATQTLHEDHPGQFFNVEYPLPLDLTRGKSKVTIRFQAQHATAGGVFDVVTLK